MRVEGRRTDKGEWELNVAFCSFMKMKIYSCTFGGSCTCLNGG